MANVNRLTAITIAILLAIGLTAGVSFAQSATPSGTTETPPAPSVTDKGAPADKGAPSAQDARPTTPGVGTDPKDAAKPDIKVETRSESRTETQPGAPGGSSGRILGLDPGVLLVVGAALLIVIVLALVAMSKKSETHDHRI